MYSLVIIIIIIILLWCRLKWLLKPQQETKKSSATLYNANITENGVDPEKVFEELHQAGIEPNFGK